MSHIEKKRLQHYTWLTRLILWFQKLKYGSPLEPAWYWSRSPNLMYGLQVFYRCLDRKSNPISVELRALLSNRIAQLNHCDFCFDISAATAEKNGISFEKLHALPVYENDSLFTAKEKIALRYADAITLKNEIIPRQLMNEVKAHFNEDEIVDLTAWICFQNMSSRFNAALDIPAQGFCKIKHQTRP